MSDTLTKLRSKKPSRVTFHQRESRRAARNPGSGLVHFYVYGPRRAKIKSPAGVYSLSKVIEVIRMGLPVKELKDLQISLAVPAEKLAPMLGISKATFHRRKGSGERLGSAVSDRVVRFARLLGKAVRVFGDEEDGRQWLGSPQFGLGGAVPLDYAKTEVGAREVENLLGRIEYGVYS
jgi:putative toxin-antitoxin system antitoxin component (TIGR02293 family)